MPEIEEAAELVESFDCPMCKAPAGSPCRTRGGKVAPKYHTPRFTLAPSLRAELEVRTPAGRAPGRVWAPGPAPTFVAPTIANAKPTRVGYARCSTALQELDSQLDALNAAGCEPIFSEKISTRIKVRPEFVKAMEYAVMIKRAVPHQKVILTVHEMKRLGRGAAELLATAEDLRAADIGLELLTGPLAGLHDPSGHGGALFAFFAGMAESEREYIREKTLEGQASARERGRHGGRPKVFDDDMLTFALALRAKGTPVPEIRKKLKIGSGKNAGKPPSLASLYRALADAEADGAVVPKQRRPGVGSIGDDHAMMAIKARRKGAPILGVEPGSGRPGPFGTAPDDGLDEELGQEAADLTQASSRPDRNVTDGWTSI